MYTVLRRVTIAGDDYMPGEYLPEDTPDGQLLVQRGFLGIVQQSKEAPVRQFSWRERREMTETQRALAEIEAAIREHDEEVARLSGEHQEFITRAAEHESRIASMGTTRDELRARQVQLEQQSRAIPQVSVAAPFTQPSGALVPEIDQSPADLATAAEAKAAQAAGLSRAGEDPPTEPSQPPDVLTEPQRLPTEFPPEPTEETATEKPSEQRAQAERSTNRDEPRGGRRR